MERSKLSKASKTQFISPWRWSNEIRTNKKWWREWLKRCLKLSQKIRSLSLLNNQNQSKSKSIKYQAIQFEIDPLQVFLILQNNRNFKNLKRNSLLIIKNQWRKISTSTFKAILSRNKSKKAYKRVQMNRSAVQSWQRVVNQRKNNPQSNNRFINTHLQCMWTQLKTHHLISIHK